MFDMKNKKRSKKFPYISGKEILDTKMQKVINYKELKKALSIEFSKQSQSDS